MREKLEVVELPSREPRRAQDPAVRIAARQPQASALRIVLELRPEKRVQLHESEPTREHVRHGAHQLGRDRAENQEGPRSRPLRVDRRSQAWEDLRKRLRLIQYEKPPGRDESLPLEVESKTFRLELEVEVVAAQRAGQGRLPDLPGGRGARRRAVLSGPSEAVVLRGVVACS